MSAPESLAKDVGAPATSPGLNSIDNAVASAEAAAKTQPNDELVEVKPESSSANEKDQILSHDASNHPFFYYKKSPSGSSQFLLHPQSVQHQNRSLYENYGTTLLFIIVLHIIYAYQWNKRCSKQDVCTNYDQLVEKKQFYRAVVAVMSHPPVDGGERGGNHTVVGSINNEAASTSVNENATVAATGISRFIPSLTFIHRFLHLARRIKQQYVDRLLKPLVSGSLSGLPLLAFCSHILWQCRALEELYVEYGGTLIGRVLDDYIGIESIGTVAIHIKTAEDTSSSSQLKQYQPDNYAYFRVLVALALTALLLEVSYLRHTLRRLDQTIDYDNSRNSPRNILKQRSMVSLCSISAALLTVYDSHFPFTPMPLLPFVRVPFLTNSGFGKTIMVLILFVLCHRIHPVTSVISGLLSGTLWSLQITSFLGEKYWGDLMLWSLAFAIVLSLKANASYSRLLSALIPCLDHVAWNRDGEVVDATTAVNASNQSERNTSAEDVEMGNTNGIRTDHLPLLSHASTISGSSTIRGRVPRIDTMDSDRN
jgi:hypothetical protein